MSLARIYTTKTVRKDWTCGKCGAAIRKGVDGRISFAVGFRGYEQTRCTRPECYPTRSELESSAVANVYAAIEGQDVDSLESLEDLEAYRDEVVAACEEVADEYEQNEMYEINPDLQERAETVRSAGDELSNWSADDEPEEEPETEDCGNCDATGWVEGEDGGEEQCPECDGTGSVETGETTQIYEDEYQTWLQEARESLREAIDSMELP